MVYKLGRLLQLIGLILLPFAVAGNVARPEEFGLGYSLGLSCVGIGVFYLGHMLRQRTQA